MFLSRATLNAILKSVPRVTWAIWLLLLSEFVAGLWTARYSASFVALGTLALTLAPIFFARRYHIYVPRSFMGMIILFIFATLFLGEVGDFYERYWWWDIALHGGSAIGFGLIGFVAIFMLFQGDRFAAPPLAIGLFAFCFAMSIGGLWEIFEYLMDQFVGTNMQKSGIDDTMADLMVDAIGGLIGAGAGVLYLWYERSVFLAGWINEFITRNRRFFSKYRSK
ncbi:hypothetical protein [Celeribacter sp.]|uniref:hypothetical protein n=1 Tax=Celeribacter sp. TaxID=1890673 RepID=UPI003A95269B